MRSYDERAKDILAKRDEKVKENMIKRRRAARLGVIAAVIALAVAASVIAVVASRAANSKPVDPGVVGTETTDTSNTAENTETSGTAETEAKEYKDGVIGERKTSDTSSPAGDIVDGGAYYWKSDDRKTSPEPLYGLPEAEADAEYEKGLIEYPDAINAVDAVAGTLSAGEWKDAVNISDWKKLLSSENWSRYVGARKLDTSNIITVKVSDGENACYNVPVKLVATQEVIYTAKTDISGCAYLFYNIAGENKTPDSVVVGEETIELDGKTELEVNAADAGIEVTALDLMLMIDTTGSMGDELEYIKAELYDVVQRVSEADKSISIRCSVNFYRDKGDDYVVKYYDFRTDINECIEQLKEQHADGGGDTPEAVHTALENAVSGHDWRDNAVKICFIVLDAPPHSESEIQGINGELLKTVKAAAEQGIRIIPVASSGVDGETEFLLRSYAVMTGGTYVFITNDSGVGFNHKEAEVGEHTVEYLNNCMVRVVCEYCGIYTGEKVPYTPPASQNDIDQFDD